MNDRELDLALADLGASRVQPTAPPMLRQRIGQVALPSKAEHGWPLPFPKRRFQSLFSVTRLVVSAVIVALFGGFLLAGVLTQPRDERLPAAASASASPQASDDAWSHLETEQVAPGVMKVAGDGTEHRLQDVTTTVVTDDGTVWMVAMPGDLELQVFQLGQPGLHRGWESAGVVLAAGQGGAAWAADNQPSGCNPLDEGPDCDLPLLDIMSFAGETTTTHSAPVDKAKSDPDRWLGPDEIDDFVVHPDGTVWVTRGHRGHGADRSADEVHFAVMHLGPSGWTSYEFGDGLPELSCADPCGWNSGGGVTITPDGSVWLNVDNAGLLRFDGSGWEAVRPLGGDEDRGVFSLAANRAGTVWAEVDMSETHDCCSYDPGRLGEERALARFDGQNWEVFYDSPSPDFTAALDGDYRGPSGIQAVGPDGTVWLTDSYQDPQTRAGSFPVSFDGERWRRFPEILVDWASDPVFDLDECCSGSWQIATAPDGTVWVSMDATRGHDSHGGVYVIRPDAPGTPPDEMRREPPSAEPTAVADGISVQARGQVSLPAEIPEGVESGTLNTPLGPARWVHLRGDDSTLPDLVEALRASTGGYITLDREGPSPRLWRSPDLVTWAPEPLPMAVEAPYVQLIHADDAVWLKTYEPTALWRSADSLDWADVSLEQLVPPEPIGPWPLELGEPLAFDGVTIVPFHHRPDSQLVNRTLGRTGHDRPWCCRHEGEPGVYRLSSEVGRFLYRVRFEEADGGLRVINIDDDAELTFLEGVSLEFIELLASNDGWTEGQGLAMLDDAALVPVGLPDAIGEHAQTAFGVDDAGFVVYGLGRDGLVHVHRSEDGLHWTETDVVGDDPGEPRDIEGVASWRGTLSIGQPDNTTWTQAADGSWTSRPDEPFALPLGNGSLRLRLDEIEMGASDRDALWYRLEGGAPISIDAVDDLGIVAQIQRDLEGDQGTGGYNFMPLSRNTAVLSYDGGGRRHLWIITFDELAG